MKKDNATDKSNEIIDKSKHNPPIGNTANPGNAGMNVPSADKVAAEFKKANHIDENGHIDSEAFKQE